MVASTKTVMYSSRIIKASALLPDTKLLLEQWDEGADVPTNLARFREENLFGKSSRSRVSDVLAIFRQRYMSYPDLLEALVILANGRLPSESLNRILYFQTVRSDQLLHDTVTDLLARTGRLDAEIRLAEVERWVAEQVAEGRTERPWSSTVQGRVARGLLATLRDFAVLEGATRKRVASIYLPISAFAFIAFQLSRCEPSGERLVRHPEWRLFLLPDAAVERLFVEAHQERLLQYHAAGQVTRIDFPVGTLPEYARVLTQRANLAT